MAHVPCLAGDRGPAPAGQCAGRGPRPSPTRYLTYTFRFSWYLAATITLLYVFNLRERLSTQRITRAAGWLFITVVLGGVLGTLVPHLEFRSVIELVLPRKATHFQFVHDLVHPAVAQLYAINGVENPRASAPFAYTNDWGLNFACLLPFFLVGWLGRDAAGLAAPRGAARPAPRALSRDLVGEPRPVARAHHRRRDGRRPGSPDGHVRLLGCMLGAAALGVVLLYSTPIGTSIQNRINHGYSNNSRSSLGAQTVDSVLGVSPVVGLGTTRNAQGSFYSIAGGSTASCSVCTPPGLGTQGHLWLVIYSTGVGGLLLYLGFMLLQFIRHVRVQMPRRSHSGSR